MIYVMICWTTSMEVFRDYWANHDGLQQSLSICPATNNDNDNESFIESMNVFVNFYIKITTINFF